MLERVSPEFEYMIDLHEKWQQEVLAEMAQELIANSDDCLK